jgi:hypothetical protein
MKKIIYKGLYDLLVRLSNRFNSQLLSKCKILLGIALLVVMSGCNKEKEENREPEEEPEIWCYAFGPPRTITNTKSEDSSTFFIEKSDRK